MRSLAIALLFALSGFCGLVYEIAWSRMLAHTLGSSIHAVTIVLAMFMAGFGIGGWVGGRLATRSSPWRTYGWIQLGLAAIGLSFGPALDLAAGAAGSDALRYAAVALGLLVPTVAMGATFPLVTAAWVRDVRRAGFGAGLLGGLNLLGAAAGALMTGFFLIRLLGIEGATRVAVGGNLAVFALSRLLADRSVEADGAAPGSAADDATSSELDTSSGPSVLPTPGDARFRIGLVAASGFASVGLQITWVRILGFFLEGFTFTFSSVVATYLIGLFAGSLAFGAFARGRASSSRLLPLATLGWTLSAVIALVVLQAYPGGPERIRFVFSQDPGALGFGAGLLLASALFLFPLTFFLGGVLPAAVAGEVGSIREVGPAVGRLYAAQNLGAVAGALVAGFVFLDAFGIKGAALAFTSVGAITFAVDLLRRGRSTAARGLAVAMLVVFAVGVVLARPTRPLILSSHVFGGSRGPEHQLVTSLEGAAGAVSVVDNLRTAERFLYTDDFLAAGTGERYHYMRLIGHLPALLAAERESALVIGFGSGTTLAALAQHPFEELRVVEILPEVYDVAADFDEVNARVLADERVDARVGDGRHHLEQTSDTFDVIALEPLMPYTPGAVALYSRDFYRIGRSRLREGGCFCQWIPVHGISTENFGVLLRSFVDVFPESCLFVYETSVLVLGWNGPLAISVPALESRAREDRVAGDLSIAGYPSGVSLLGSFATAGPPLLEWLGEGPTMTDDRPVLEFYPLPRSMVASYGSDNLAWLLEGWTYPGPFLVGDAGRPIEEPRHREIRPWSRAGRELTRGVAEATRADYLGVLRQGEEAGALRTAAQQSMARALSTRRDWTLAYRALVDQRYRTRIGEGLAAMRDRRFKEAVASFRAAIELRADRHLAHYHLGNALDGMGDRAASRKAYDDALQRFPRHTDSLWRLADLDLRDGDRTRAKASLERALELGGPCPMGARDRARILRELDVKAP